MTRRKVDAVVAAARAKGERPNLYGANLFGTDLTDANLVGANLYAASLNSAHLADDPMTLIEHEVERVRAWVARRVADPDTLMQLAINDTKEVRYAVLKNPNCTDEIRVAVTLQQ